MKPTTPAATLEVSALQVGMFIQLDLGWMDHPFPRSAFRLSSQEQIDTLRGLGLQRVRWVPQRSDAQFDPDRTFTPTTGEPALAADPALTLTPADAIRPADAVAFAAPAAAHAHAAATAERVVGPEARARRDDLHSQREAMQLCREQFGEATAAYAEVLSLTQAAPVQAGARSQQLAQAFVTKMLGDHDLSIRLLAEDAGDKAALHAINVAVISLLLGRNCGLGEDEMLDLGVGAMLHDIGKEELPPRVRHQHAAMSPAERHAYEEHVALGVSAGRRMGLRAGALLVIGQHHEHADGTGYPLHIKAERLTPAASIVALVNRYDNLCNPLVPSRGLTPHEAVSVLFSQWRDRLEPSLLNAFIKMMGVYPPGSVVQLTDDRFALVTACNGSRPLKPRVLVHDPAVPREEALHVDLQAASGLGIRRAVKPLTLPPAALNYLSPRARTVYFFEPATEARALEAAA